MKKISLLLLAFCIFSCTHESEPMPQLNEPESELAAYIQSKTLDGLLKDKPMVILDGALTSIEALTSPDFEADGLDIEKMAVLRPENKETRTVFGEAGSNGVLIIRTKEADQPVVSGSFNSDKVLILLNGKPTSMDQLDNNVVGDIAAIHVLKNSDITSVLSGLGYESIVQVETK